ncbi:MerR family transcriptional regulator [Chloroflexota bacterium]
MATNINGRTYYRTAEACNIVGVSRNTLFRWLENGLIGENERRDRRGWRLFTEDEIRRLRIEANRITTHNTRGSNGQI